MCAPTPNLIKSKRTRKRLPVNEVDESSAPPATPIVVQKVPGCVTVLEGFSDVLKNSRLQNNKSLKQCWAPPPEITGDTLSTGLELEEYEDLSDFEIEPSHDSLKELFSEVSLPLLGKNVLNFHSTGQYDEFAAIMKTFELARPAKFTGQ